MRLAIVALFLALCLIQSEAWGGYGYGGGYGGYGGYGRWGRRDDHSEETHLLKSLLAEQKVMHAEDPRSVIQALVDETIASKHLTEQEKSIIKRGYYGGYDYRDYHDSLKSNTDSEEKTFPKLLVDEPKAMHAEGPRSVIQALVDETIASKHLTEQEKSIIKRWGGYGYGHHHHHHHGWKRDAHLKEKTLSKFLVDEPKVMHAEGPRSVIQALVDETIASKHLTEQEKSIIKRWRYGGYGGGYGGYGGYGRWGKRDVLSEEKAYPKFLVDEQMKTSFLQDKIEEVKKVLLIEDMESKIKSNYLHEELNVLKKELVKHMAMDEHKIVSKPIIEDEKVKSIKEESPKPRPVHDEKKHL